MTTQPHRDDDLDAVLAGRAPLSAESATLSDAFTAMRSIYVVEPCEETVTSFAQQLASTAALSAPAAGSATRVTPMRRKRRSFVAALATAGIAAMAVGGAAAADEAAPGDALYGVDRALESFGIYAGGADERLDEAEELVDDGDLEGALEASEEAVESMDDLDDADEAEITGLLQAAQSVLSSGSESSEEVRTRVSEMLTFMAETELTGRDFGQAVSLRARGLTETDDAEVEDVEDEATDTEVASSGEEDVADVETADAADDADADAAAGNSANADANSNAGGNSANSNSNAGGNSADANSNAGGNSANSNSNAGGNSANSNSNAGGNSANSNSNAGGNSANAKSSDGE